MINLGEDSIKLMLGNAEVSKAYIGTEQVYPNEQPFFARLTYQNGDVYEIEGSGELKRTMVTRGITDSSDPHYYTQITNAEIGELCTNIGTSAFSECSGLTSVEIPNSVTRIDYYTFKGCSSLTSMEIPDGVKTIYSSAFYGCSGLTSVEIPNSVTSISSHAFWGCSGLTSVFCRRITPPSLNVQVFNNTNDCPIYVPAESVSAYKSATNWSDYASRIYAIP